MSNWDKLWENLTVYLNQLDNKNLITSWLTDIKAEGDKLQDKTRELDAYLSVEQLLAKRWEKFIELMGDDEYTELTPEEYVSQLDDREQKLETIHCWINDKEDPVVIRALQSNREAQLECHSRLETKKRTK